MALGGRGGHAGLGLGTKYPGLFLLGSVLLASLFSMPIRGRVWAHTKRVLAICAITFGVYLVTTPGTLLDPVEFMVQTRDISSYYGKTHYGYTATSGFDHLRTFFTTWSMSYFCRTSCRQWPRF